MAKAKNPINRWNLYNEYYKKYNKYYYLKKILEDPDYNKKLHKKRKENKLKKVGSKLNSHMRAGVNNDQKLNKS